MKFSIGGFWQIIWTRPPGPDFITAPPRPGKKHGGKKQGGRRAYLKALRGK